MSQKSPEQRYGPTSGIATGVFGLVVVAVMLGAAAASGLSPGSVRTGLAAAALAILAWAFLLKPRIIVEEGGHILVLRNPLVSHRIPLAAVKVVGVRTVTTVKTEEGRFDAVAVGYPLRKIVRGGAARAPRALPGLGIPGPELPAKPPRTREPHAGEGDIQELMTNRILAAAERARATGVEAGRVERRYAVVEIGLLVALAIGFLLTFVL